ncbi:MULTISPECIES: bestrophin-like domain [Streptomyces]|uniref:DUF4239 domain-containing protein n=1 Tax=Streptomyces noboritoensis TaxID=67337 RepID=A0ABV6TB40_9ACTN|nr:DUF4239 domain-containing protein [Streptomyces melanogenes]GGP75260.1 hypothetical protein GCM10010278_61770 [Streptomyces melanogenes]
MPVLGFALLLGVAVAATVAAGAVYVLARIIPADSRRRHNDVLGFVYAEIGVIYAVVLAMVVVGVWDTHSREHANTYTETDALLQISWYARSLPQPERTTLTRLTESYTSTVIYKEWPMLAQGKDSAAAWALFTDLREFINVRQPETGADQARYQSVLDAVGQLGNARRERVNEAATAGVPALLWAALLVGALMTVGFVYLFEVGSLRVHAGAVCALAFTVGVMLLIVYQFNHPFGGTLKIKPTAFELAIHRMQALDARDAG